MSRMLNTTVVGNEKIQQLLASHNELQTISVNYTTNLEANSVDSMTYKNIVLNLLESEQRSKRRTYFCILM